MNATEMIAQIRYMVDEATAVNWQPEELLIYINHAQQWFVSLMIDLDRDWFVKSANLNTTANTPTIALPADFIRAKRVEWINGDTALVNPPVLMPSFWQVSEYVTQWPWGDVTPAQTGTPVRFMFQGANIRLHPCPSTTKVSAIRLFYCYAPADLVTSPAATTSEVPVQWHNVIVLKAAIQAMQKMEQNTTVFDKELAMMTDIALRQMMRRQTAASMRIIDNWD